MSSEPLPHVGQFQEAADCSKEGPGNRPSGGPTPGRTPALPRSPPSAATRPPAGARGHPTPPPGPRRSNLFAKAGAPREMRKRTERQQAGGKVDRTMAPGRAGSHVPWGQGGARSPTLESPSTGKRHQGRDGGCALTPSTCARHTRRPDPWPRPLPTSWPASRGRWPPWSVPVALREGHCAPTTPRLLACRATPAALTVTLLGVTAPWQLSVATGPEGSASRGTSSIPDPGL